MTAFYELALGYAAFCFVSAMLLSLLRLFRGPSAQDRILAFDTVYINATLTVLMLGIRTTSAVYFDVALLLAVFGFVSTTALAKFLLRGEVIEP